MIPDKIWVNTDTLQGYHMSNHPPYGEEYIRKDALLEYLRKEHALVDFHLKAQDDPVWWGQRNAFQQVIDKIQSV